MHSLSRTRPASPNTEGATKEPIYDTIESDLDSIIKKGIQKDLILQPLHNLLLSTNVTQRAKNETQVSETNFSRVHDSAQETQKGTGVNPQPIDSTLSGYVRMKGVHVALENEYDLLPKTTNDLDVMQLSLAQATPPVLYDVPCQTENANERNDLQPRHVYNDLQPRHVYNVPKPSRNVSEMEMKDGSCQGVYDVPKGSGALQPQGS